MRAGTLPSEGAAPWTQQILQFQAAGPAVSPLRGSLTLGSPLPASQTKGHPPTATCTTLANPSPGWGHLTLQEVNTVHQGREAVGVRGGGAQRRTEMCLEVAGSGGLLESREAGRAPAGPTAPTLQVVAPEKLPL